MKNILGTLILIVILSTSCSKDDDISPENLVGTIWLSDDLENRLEFTSEVACKYTWTDYVLYNSKVGYPQEEDGIYTIDGDKINFDFGYEDITTGVINENSISFTWIGNVVVVKKQE